MWDIVAIILDSGVCALSMIYMAFGPMLFLCIISRTVLFGLCSLTLRLSEIDMALY